MGFYNPYSPYPDIAGGAKETFDNYIMGLMWKKYMDMYGNFNQEKKEGETGEESAAPPKNFFEGASLSPYQNMPEVNPNPFGMPKFELAPGRGQGQGPLGFQFPQMPTGGTPPQNMAPQAGQGNLTMANVDPSQNQGDQNMSAMFAMLMKFLPMLLGR